MKSEVAGYDISEPVIQSSWCGVDCGVWRVDADSCLGEAEERVLLCVVEG